MNIRGSFFLHNPHLFLSTVFFLLLFPVLTSSFAQQVYQPDTQFVAPKKKTRTVTTKVEREPAVQLNGALIKAFQLKRPWQIVSPFAPPSAGYGEDIISENPEQLGRMRGVTLFGIDW